MQDSNLTKPATRARWGVLVFLALSALGAYLTRGCIAVANTSIQEQLNITDKQMGWIMGGFFVSYCFFQIPGGWLGNRFGTRSALAGINVAWSLCTIWTGLLSSFFPMLLSRIFFGCSQAGLVPITGKIINDWSPEARRGFYSSVIGASMSAGGALASLLTGILIAYLSWRNIFFLYSMFGLVWAFAFYAWFRTKPEDHPGVNQAELKLIRCPADEDSELEQSPQKETNSPAPTVNFLRIFTQLFKNLSIWGICLQAFFRAAGYTVFVSWFPAFLEYSFDTPRDQAGILTSTPLIGVIVGSLVGGVLIDKLLNSTNSKWISRCGLAIVSLTGCGLLTVASSWTKDLTLFITLISISSLFSGAGNPAAWAATIDLAGKHTAFVLAVMNMAGTFGAFLTPVILGDLIDHIKSTNGDWNLVIYYMAFTNLCGAVCWFLVNPNKTVDNSDKLTTISEES